MPAWTIVIEGVGPHSQENLSVPIDNDADTLLEKFVQVLKTSGQTIESATFIHGKRIHKHLIPPAIPIDETK
jgi:hypothetical protein